MNCSNIDENQILILKLIIVSISEISKIGEICVTQTGYGCKQTLKKSIGKTQDPRLKIFVVEVRGGCLFC